MEAFFLRIVNISIMASWLILAILVLRLALKKAPNWIICLLWALVAVRLVFPFSIESAVSLIPSAKPLPDDFIYTAHPYIDSGIDVIDRAVNPVLSASLEAQMEFVASANPTQIVSFAFSRLWILGIALMLLYAIISTAFLKHRLLTATLYEKGIKQSENVSSPFVLGVFRPVIYLPYDLKDTSLEYVIRHEKAHIARRDYIWKPLGFLILSIYWFNPFIWVAYIFLCRDIEAACDEKVIKDMSLESRRAYSTALLECGTKKRMITACPVAFGENAVKTRIKEVMNYKKPAFWVIIAAVCAGIIVAVCFLTNPRENAGNDNPVGESALEEQDTINDFGDNENENTVTEPTPGVSDNKFIKAELGDIDCDGTNDYIVTNQIEGEPVFGETESFEWTLVYNGDEIYKGHNILPCDFDEKGYFLDFDNDGEKEILIIVYPHVNSMPLTEYVVLKRDQNTWKELMNSSDLYGVNETCNAFLIRGFMGQDLTMDIVCEGLDYVINTDISSYYGSLAEQVDELPELAKTASKILSGEMYNKGDLMAATAAYGIWEVRPDYYLNAPCIVATHGLCGIEGGKYDLLGEVDIFFNYDSQGCINILKMLYLPRYENKYDEYESGFIKWSDYDAYACSSPGIIEKEMAFDKVSGKFCADITPDAFRGYDEILISFKNNSGKELWSSGLGTPHMAWGSYYCYSDNGKDYLIYYYPNTSQDMVSYAFSMFTIDENGNEQIICEYYADSIEEIADFNNNVEPYMKKAKLLISTINGLISTSILTH